jgi:hypothetical protein
MNFNLLTAERFRVWILPCCLALGLAPLALAGEAYIQPTITGYLEELDDGTPSYSRFTGVVRYGLYSNPPALGTDHAFLKFSLDSLPDSILITNAELAYDQFEHTGGPPVVDIRLIRDPIAQPPHDAFYGILNGRVLTAAAPSPDGWALWQLDTIAGPLLDSCHRVGVASFGIHWSGSPGDTFRAAAYGYDSSSAPYLHVVYTPPGVSENRNSADRRPGLSLLPNPTNGTHVAVTSGITTRTSLTLRDVLGNAVVSFSLDPAGRTRLNLHGLPPGVYVATLDGTMPLVSRKLVIAAR